MFYTTLNVILEEESHVKIKPSNLSLAIIWLNRALQFIRAFTSGLSREYRNKVAEENLRTTILQAYEGTLRPYHGAMTQFLFSNIARLVPCRKSFHRALMMDKTASVDMVISDIDLYLPTFSDTLDLLEELLNEFELTSAEVV
uniref:Glycolipid transfer protein domain-containing protein n=1 Tax=Arion vulgaris TaxID=1028688 RepID=A0A0B6ZLF3_9EUPU